MTVASGPNIATTGLQISFDTGNPKSYSTNIIPKPTDIYGWCGSAGVNAASISRDTTISPSPANGIPLKMAVTGNDPYIASYGNSTWNLAPASNGQTWTASCYVRASTSTVAGFFIFGANSSGNYIQLNASQTAITTEWQRISLSYAITDPLVAYVQLRLDGPDSGGAGIDIWWDGLQLELGSAATQFNSYPNINNSQWRNTLAGSSATVTNSPLFSSSNNGYLTFNGSTNYATYTVPSSFSLYCLETWWYNTNTIPNNDTPIGGPTTYQSPFMFNNDYPCGVNLGAWTGGMTNEAIHIWSGTSSSYGATYTRQQVAIGWHHIVFSWNGTTYDIYVDGVQQTAYPLSGGLGSAPLQNLSSIQIGYSTPGYYFNGNYGIVNCYSSALSSTQVIQNFNALRGRYGI